METTPSGQLPVALEKTTRRRACSQCRKRKIRCVVENESPDRCEACIDWNKPCDLRQMVNAGKSSRQPRQSSPHLKPPKPPKPRRQRSPYSHSGCAECKRRKVKCDERQPLCTRCSTRGSECTYPEPKPSRFVLADPTRRITERDPFLMDYYITAVPPILEPDMIPTLNATIRSHAHKFPYVLHAALAFSRLHLASCSSPSEGAKYRYAALVHKDTALKLLMSSTKEGLTKATAAEPHLATLAMLATCYLALLAADPGRTMNFDPIDILAEVAGVLQSINSIVHHDAYKDLPRNSTGSLSPHDSNSRATQTTRSPGNDGRWPDTMSSLQQCVDTLLSLPPTTDTREKQRRLVIGHAASELQTSFGKTDVRGDFHVLGMWLGTVDHEFVGFIQARDPIALLLLAHWVIWWSEMDDIWWARGWPATTVEAISEALDDRHRPLLGWCLSQMRRVEEGTVHGV